MKKNQIHYDSSVQHGLFYIQTPQFTKRSKMEDTAARISTLMMTMRVPWMITAETIVMKQAWIDHHTLPAPSAQHRGTAAPTMLLLLIIFHPTSTNATTFSKISNAARSTSQLLWLGLPHHSRLSSVDNPFNISDTGLPSWTWPHCPPCYS